MDVQREGCEVEVVGEWLDGSTEPWQWWDRERIVHREVTEEERGKIGSRAGKQFNPFQYRQ